MDLLAARIEARISSVISTAEPFTMALVQRFNTSSGAPLVYWMMVPSAALWTVDIIFRMESKGASPTRGHAAFSSGFKRPFLAASLTRAHSVGSPMAWPASASHSESEQRAMGCFQFLFIVSHMVHYGHPVLGQRTSLIRADDLGTA